MNPRIKDTMVLHVGDKFVTQQEVPLLTVETVEIATFAESIDYETKHKESSAYYKGETIVTQTGEKGKARVTARLTKQNGKTVERKDLSVKTIKEPVSKIVIKGTKALPPTKGTGRFIRPSDTHLNSARAATSVLPKPTSPQSRRSMENGFSMSCLISSIARS